MESAGNKIDVVEKPMTRKTFNGTVILFYKYTTVENPEQERNTQKKWWEELGVTGRMRIGHEGINANLYGLKDSIEEYKRRMESSALWQGIEYKHSNPRIFAPNEDPFNGQKKIRVSEEITGTGPEMKKYLPACIDPSNGGVHLNPKEFDDLVKRSMVNEDTVIIDTRNHYETNVGKFRNAVDPKLRVFAEFPAWVRSNQDKLKGKNIGLYCTGGIRCEKASTFVKSLGIAKEVYQLHGGISNYLTEFSVNTGKEKGIYIDVPATGEIKPNTSSRPSEECVYDGVNFQFDSRFGEESVGVGNDIPGKCYYCFNDCTSNLVIDDDDQCVICASALIVCSVCKPVLQMKSILCPEHILLSDEWESYILRLMQNKWTPYDLSLARSHLVKNLNTEVYIHQNAWKFDRKQDLNLQIARLDQFLEKYPEYAANIDGQDSFRDAQIHDSFIPYVPLFNP